MRKEIYSPFFLVINNFSFVIIMEYIFIGFLKFLTAVENIKHEDTLMYGQCILQLCIQNVAAQVLQHFRGDIVQLEDGKSHRNFWSEKFSWGSVYDIKHMKERTLTGWENMIIVHSKAKILGQCWIVLRNLLYALWQLLGKSELGTVFSRTLELPCAT